MSYRFVPQANAIALRRFGRAELRGLAYRVSERTGLGTLDTAARGCPRVPLDCRSPSPEAAVGIMAAAGARGGYLRKFFGGGT